MASEFDIIARYFTRPARCAVLGVGDDAAIVQVTQGRQLAITTDSLVAGTHFFPDTEPGPLGHKCLAVNLSDLAAMGAQPRYALLALTMPVVREEWIAEFASGFLHLAELFEVDLIGGDTTEGPLSITVTAVGETLVGKALTRSGARTGDDVWVSGVLGEAALALGHLRGHLRLQGEDLEHCLKRLNQPTPRVSLGENLVGLATAAIDVSDGLVADLGHICERSGVGAHVDYAAIPCAAHALELRGLAPVREALLAGGDDYELLFTAAPGSRREIGALSARLNVAVSRIGRIVQGSEVTVLDDSGAPIVLPAKGFEHFR